MADDEFHPCPLCSKRYKRREHMQRHWTSHNPAKQYNCPQCSRAFQRLDVLKRHVRTCEARARGWMAPAGKRRACDLCVRQKKACSMGQPCENCERLSVACHYTFPKRHEHISHASALSVGSDSGESQTIQATGLVCADTVPVDDLSSAILGDPIGPGILGPPDTSPIWTDFLELMQGGPFAENFAIPENPQQTQSAPHKTGGRRYTFMFLENFTRRTGLLESFECGSPALREQAGANFIRKQADGYSLQTPGLPDTLGTLSTVRLLAEAPPFTTVPNQWLHDPLMIKIHQIIALAKEVVTLKPRNSVVTMEWSALLEQKCIDFFSLDNVRKFIELYWAIWHPNVNLVHRPTFDPAAASPTLLAAMTVMGTISSSLLPALVLLKRGRP